MQKYIVRRLLVTIPILFGITVINFLVMNAAPGDPVSNALMVGAPGQSIGDPEAQRELLGLNKPLPVRYVLWLKELLRGNMGESLVTRRPVLQVIGERVGPTVQLSALALFLSFAIAVPVGIISAVRQYSWLDYAVTVATFISASMPGFFFAILAIYILALTLGWFPISGTQTIGAPWSLKDYLWHMALPAGVLALPGSASLARYARSQMLDTIHQDYLATARAKGLRRTYVLVRHALPNAILPLITLAALDVPALFSGAVIAETIFRWPGMGQLGVTAAFARDYTVLMGLGVISATLVVLSSLLADILYAVLDPRIRYD